MSMGIYHLALGIDATSEGLEILRGAQNRTLGQSVQCRLSSHRGSDAALFQFFCAHQKDV